MANTDLAPVTSVPLGLEKAIFVFEAILFTKYKEGHPSQMFACNQKAYWISNE
jgi:hypothetical protein